MTLKLPRRPRIHLEGRVLPLTVALIVAAVFSVSAWEKLGTGGMWNLYAHQAESFLQGRLFVDVDLHDVALYEGKRFVPFPPFPSVVLMPFVALFGVKGTPVVALAVVLGALSGYLLVRLLQSLELPTSVVLLASTGFFLGTAYWSAVRASEGVWFLAHVVAVLCVLAALHQALVCRSAWSSGFWLGFAFLSRQMTIYLSLFLLMVLLSHEQNAGGRRRLGVALAFVLPLSVCVAGYLVFNHLRFGSPFETGYPYIRLTGHLAERVSQYGLFSLAYLPFNAIYLFLQGFHIRFAPPEYLQPIELDPFGSALFAASPFVAAAFWARWRLPLLLGVWASIGLIVAHTLLYYNNGSLQWNAQRFTLDFLPAMMILVGLGMRHHTSVWVLATAYAVLLNVIAVFAFQR